MYPLLSSRIPYNRTKLALVFTVGTSNTVHYIRTSLMSEVYCMIISWLNQAEVRQTILFRLFQRPVGPLRPPGLQGPPSAGGRQYGRPCLPAAVRPRGRTAQREPQLGAGGASKPTFATGNGKPTILYIIAAFVWQVLCSFAPIMRYIITAFVWRIVCSSNVCSSNAYRCANLFCNRSIKWTSGVILIG